MTRHISEFSTPFKLEFRNASNGYYGGSIEHSDRIEWDCLKPLTEDF